MPTLKVTLGKVKFGESKRFDADQYGGTVTYPSATGKFIISGRYPEPDVTMAVTISTQGGDQTAVQDLRAAFHDLALALVEVSKDWAAPKP